MSVNNMHVRSVDCRKKLAHVPKLYDRILNAVRQSLNMLFQFQSYLYSQSAAVVEKLAYQKELCAFGFTLQKGVVHCLHDGTKSPAA